MYGTWAVVTYDSKRPVLLPKNHPISYLITEDTHEANHTDVATITARTDKKEILDYRRTKIGIASQEVRLL